MWGVERHIPEPWGEVTSHPKTRQGRERVPERGREGDLSESQRKAGGKGNRGQCDKGDRAIWHVAKDEQGGEMWKKEQPVNEKEKEKD